MNKKHSKRKRKYTTTNRRGYVCLLFCALARPALLRQDDRDHDRDGLSFQWKRSGTVFATKGQAAANGKKYCEAFNQKGMRQIGQTPAMRYVVIPVGDREVDAVKVAG